LADLRALEQALGVSFHDPSLLEQALVHSSYLNEPPGLALVSNERLEFLGDAILGFLVAEKLYHDHPELSEGEMTRLRSVLVCRDTLARVARNLGLGQYLYLGKGEEMGGGRDKEANLAGALEAVLAAVFLDQGLTAAKELVLRLFGAEFHQAVRQGVEVDYKSRLQELSQSRYRLAPSYRLLEEVGPDHDKRFTVEVVVGDRVLGTGSGRNKKMAEAEAARAALEQLLGDFTP
jgi:ribonuclease-3